MEEAIALCTIFGVFIIISFILGARVGQKIVKGEEVKIELPNPVNKIREHKEIKEAEKEQTKMDIMVENIDNYDGTDLGQKEIPK